MTFRLSPLLPGYALAAVMALAALAAPPATPAIASAPVPADRASVLADVHGCWTSTAPADMAGKVPGHVVATLPDGRTVYGGPALVGKALEQAFDAADHGLTVKAFCR